MVARFRRSALAAVAAVLALACWQGKAQAHPHLVGPWFAPVPPGGFMVFEFGVGEYLGDGIWRGPFSSVISHMPAAVGDYELRMFNGTQGTLSLREKKTGPGWSVGIVDFSVPAVYYQDVTYRRR